MRNLKRALSLALASVMLVGMMVVGTGASYADVTSDNNQEAIEVLQAVGIMTGDDQGNFNPDQNVTRNEMAVIMCNLLDYRAASYAGTTPFTDVPDWAEPYVAACYANGITGGTSETTYSGDESVTTVQAALMLMKALGYFQFSSDFQGGWEVATIAQANRIDLFEDVESGAREALTRSGVAQLVLNTLESGMVEPDDDTIKVEADNVTVEAGSVRYEYVVSSSAYARAISSVQGVSSTSISTSGPIVELGEKLYNGDLKKAHSYNATTGVEDDTTSDEFGRPATRWTYKTSEIGTYGIEPDAVYTGKMSKDNLYDLLGKDVVDNYTMELFVDGAPVYTGDITTTYAQANSSSASCNSGKGVLTQVYMDSDTELVTIAVSNTYLMQATGDYNTGRETVAVTVLTGSATVNSLSSNDFEGLEDLAEDDYILYTYADGRVQSVAKAEVLTGDVTAYSVGLKSDGKTERDTGDASGSVTIDGTQYDYAKWAETDDENGCATTFNVGSSAALVLDAYGYVLYVDDAALSVGNYVYIDAIAKETNLSTKDIADAYFYDGTNETITIKELRNADGDKQTITYGTGETRTTSYNGWYSYSRNSADEYTLTAAKTSGVGTAKVVDGNNVIQNNTVALFKDSSSKNVNGNSSTIFIVKDQNDDIVVYTGITNVPDITLKGAGMKITYMLDKDTANKAASLVYVDVGDDGRLKSAVTSMLYTLKLDKTYVDSEDNEPVESWIVVLDGEVTTVETKENWTKGQSYVDYSIDADGYYEEGTTFSSDLSDNDKDIVDLKMSGNSSISQSGDTLTFVGGNSTKGYDTSYVVNSDTQVTLIMLPTNKGDAYALSGEIMEDNNADYEVANFTAKTLANTFKDRTVEGTAYVVYDDQNSSDLLEKVYVVVTACSFVDNSGENEGVDLSDLYIQEGASGALTINTAETLSPKEVADTIKAYLNDSDITNVAYDKANNKATITYDGGSSEEIAVTVNTVATEEEVTAIKMVDDAIQGVVDSDYEWKGEITVSGNSVTATGDSSYVTDPGEDKPTQATADLARFLGALYRDCGAAEIVYNKTEYTWNAASGREGSNWENDGNTLVSAIVASVEGKLSSGTASETIEVDGCPMTFTITIEAGE